MPEFKTTIEIQTGIGLVKAHSQVTANSLTKDQISLKKINFEPLFPSYMRLKKCTALLLIIDHRTTIQHLDFSISLTSKALGSPCTGEHLEAQEWNDNGRLLVIGTEDSDALKSRLPLIKGEDVIINYAPHSLTLSLRDLPKSEKWSFHFILAENNYPEPVESSAWFAVDQSHSYLLKQLSAQ